MMKKEEKICGHTFFCQKKSFPDHFIAKKKKLIHNFKEIFQKNKNNFCHSSVTVIFTITVTFTVTVAVTVTVTCDGDDKNDGKNLGDGDGQKYQ